MSNVTIDTKELVALVAKAVAEVRNTPPAVEADEIRTFHPGSVPNDLDRKVLCKGCLSGRPNHQIPEEEQRAWLAGVPMSRHQLPGIPQIITYNATKAAARLKAGTQTQCINDGTPLDSTPPDRHVRAVWWKPGWLFNRQLYDLGRYYQ